MNQSPLLGRPGAMWASLCVSSVCMHLSSVLVSLPPPRALSLGPGPASLCSRAPLTLMIPLPLAVRAGPRSDALAQAVHPQPAAANVQDVAGLEPQAAAAFAAKAPPEVREGTGARHRGKGACVKVGRCVVDGEDIGPAGEAVDDGMQVAAGRCRLVAVEVNVEDAPAADGEGVSNARVWDLGLPLRPEVRELEARCAGTAGIAAPHPGKLAHTQRRRFRSGCRLWQLCSRCMVRAVLPRRPRGQPIPEGRRRPLGLRVVEGKLDCKGEVFIPVGRLSHGTGNANGGPRPVRVRKRPMVARQRRSHVHWPRTPVDLCVFR